MRKSVLIITATSEIVKNRQNNNYYCCSCGFFIPLNIIMFLGEILISQHCKETHLCLMINVFITVIIFFCIPFLSLQC